MGHSERQLKENDRKNSGGTKGNKEKKEEKERKERNREKKRENERKRKKERKREKNMSRVNYYRSVFNSQKEKLNILAEMLEIPKSCRARRIYNRPPSL